MNIGILGLGGVGGYFGGLLASHFDKDDAVRIILLTRPSTGQLIMKEGLRLSVNDAEQTIHPVRVAWSAESAGPLDVMICATKSYDLADALQPFKTCLSADTLILPLLNGVDAAGIIASVTPGSPVLDGCVYINARRTSPGVIVKTGSIEKIIFGARFPGYEQRLARLQEIFVAAGIDSHLSEKIETDVWEKCIFIAAIASATSYYDENIGTILNDTEHRAALEGLVQEAIAVARARKIALPADIETLILQRIRQLNPGASSSMHSDFKRGGKTEFLSLTKYLSDLGSEMGIDTPTFDTISERFMLRSNK